MPTSNCVVLGAGAAAVVTVGAGDVGNGVADEEVGRHGVGGLDAGPGEDVDPAVTGHGFHDDVEVVAEFGEVTESAGQVGQGVATGGAAAGDGAGGGVGGQEVVPLKKPEAAELKLLTPPAPVK